MDKAKITTALTRCMLAVETVTVCGDHNRQQLSGIYRELSGIIAELQKEDDNGGQVDR